MESESVLRAMLLLLRLLLVMARMLLLFALMIRIGTCRTLEVRLMMEWQRLLVLLLLLLISRIPVTILSSSVFMLLLLRMRWALFGYGLGLRSLLMLGWVDIHTDAHPNNSDTVGSAQLLENTDHRNDRG